MSNQDKSGVGEMKNQDSVDQSQELAGVSIENQGASETLDAVTGLLPCPCGRGGRRPQVQPTCNTRDMGRQYWQVQCENCGRKGAFAPSVYLATSLWNYDREQPSTKQSSEASSNPGRGMSSRNSPESESSSSSKSTSTQQSPLCRKCLHQGQLDSDGVCQSPGQSCGTCGCQCEFSTPVTQQSIPTAAKKVAKVVPVGHSYTVTIGSLGLKMYDTMKGAQEVCDAINAQVARIITDEIEVKDGEG